MEKEEKDAHTSKQNLVKSVVLTGFGGYENIQVKEWPLPSVPGTGEVEVQVKVCGINFADIYTRAGLMRNRKPPYVLGMEAAGDVTAIGENVQHLKVGDRVVCYQHTGDLYRESVILSAARCFVIPNNMSYEDAAALPANYLTAYLCVFDIGNLRDGQSILIHSCAGGVGCAATQLANAVGDNVMIYGTTRKEKHDTVKKIGVRKPLHPETYVDELRELSPDGVDVVIDNQAGINFTISQQLLKPLGRVVLIGANSAIQNANDKLSLWAMLKMWWTTKYVNPTELMIKSTVVSALNLGTILEKDPQRIDAAMKHLFKLYQKEKIKPQIHTVLPFEKAVDAMRILADRKNIGKVLLRVTEE